MTETGADVGAGSDTQAASRTATLLVAELQHRARNLFAVIHALALRSLDGDSPIEQARDAFIGRLDALARADQQLINGEWKGTSLRDLVRSELKPFADRIAIEGADVTLNPRVVQNFALALHELATNASKYGALSGPDGMVSVGWVVSRNSSSGTLIFRWQECDGPPVSPPERTGFGTSLLKTVLGEGRLDYAIEGLTYEAEMPLSTIIRRWGPSSDRLSTTELNEREEPAAMDGDSAILSATFPRVLSRK